MVDENPKGFCAAALVPGPDEDILLIIDPSKRTPHYLKFPRGWGEPGERPAECASRETYQETGAYIPWETLDLIHKEDRGDHDMYYFLAPKVKSWDGLKKVGDEGEIVAVRKIRDMIASTDFFPSERHFLNMILKHYY